MNLRNVGALITGGGTGTGRAVAHALAAEGCRVAITGRRAEKLQETASSCPNSELIQFKAADVSSRDDVQELMAWANGSVGNIHILVNCAGVNVKQRSTQDLSPDDFDRMLKINCTGAFNTMWAVLPQMRERQDGLIVNINSVAGLRASTLAGVGYSTSKYAMTALGLGVALEEGENGIRVTNIYPGEINTPILDERPIPVSDERKATLLQPTDLAATVVYLANLPPTAHVAELVIKPIRQDFS